MYAVVRGWVVVFCGMLQLSTIFGVLRDAGASVHAVALLGASFGSRPGSPSSWRGRQLFNQAEAMNTYFSLLWTTVQRCAREALAALEPHIDPYTFHWAPSAQLECIGSAAPLDPHIPFEVRLLLVEAAGIAGFGHGDRLAGAVTMHVLEALRVIAESDSREQAFARLVSVPGTGLLFEGSAGLKIRLNPIWDGRCADRKAQLLALYVHAYGHFLQATIVACAGDTESWKRGLTYQQLKEFWIAWNSVVEGRGMRKEA